MIHPPVLQAAGTALPSYVQAGLEQQDIDEYDLKWTAFSLYIAGGDTVSTHLVKGISGASD
jgi:hypothetical protein